MNKVVERAINYIKENVALDLERERLIDWIDYMIDGDDTPDMTDLDAVVNWIKTEFLGIEQGN